MNGKKVAGMGLKPYFFVFFHRYISYTASTRITIAPPRKNASAISGINAAAEAPDSMETGAGVPGGTFAMVAYAEGVRFAAVSDTPFDPATVTSGVMVALGR